MLRSPHLEPEAIRAAHARIHPAFRGSPQYVHDGLSALAGTPVVVKVETANPIRSFKGRGTWIAVSALAGEGRIGRTGRSPASVPATSARAWRSRPASTGSRPSSSARHGRTGARSPGCARSEPRSTRAARTSTRPAARPRRGRRRTTPSCSSTVTIRGSRPARPRRPSRSRTPSMRASCPGSPLPSSPLATARCSSGWRRGSDTPPRRSGSSASRRRAPMR